MDKTMALELINAQLHFFEEKIKQNSSHSKTQATYWPLKYKFEQLLKYVTNPSSTRAVAASTGKKKKGRPASYLDELIMNFLQKQSTVVQVSTIRNSINEQLQKTINESTFANQISKLCNKGIIKRVSKGMYRAERVVKDE